MTTRTGDRGGSSGAGPVIAADSTGSEPRPAAAPSAAPAVAPADQGVARAVEPGRGGLSRRDPHRRRALLDAADRVILRQGPDASMAEIASEAGISKPILYRHFGDKSGLYQALAERHAGRLVAVVRAEFVRTDDLRTRARATIDTYLAAISDNLNLYRFLMHRASAEDAATHSVMGVIVRRMAEQIAEALVVEGRLDPVRAHVWGHATVGMVQAAGDWWLDHPEVPRAAVVDGLVELVLDGLRTAIDQDG
jgi:AcrR family transcriptional regulator